MNVSRTLLVVSAALLSACGASSAVPQDSASLIPSTSAPAITMVSKQFTELGIEVKIPDTLLGGISTFEYDAAAQADVTSQTGCTNATVVTFEASDGNNYPVGSFFTCIAPHQLGTEKVTPVTGTNIVFQSAIEKPFGLNTSDQANFETVIAQLSNSANYATN